jgi:hypothetical protein
MLALAQDGHGGGGTRPQKPLSKSAAVALPDSEEGSFGPAPTPLPNDPALRAELLARLDRGVEEALAGRGRDSRVVHARLRAKYNLP